MWSSKSNQIARRSTIVRRIVVAGWIGTGVGAVTESKAQQLLPADRQEIADQERLSWTLSKFPPQPYMIQRPSTRCVPVKTDDQLDLQALHRVRSRLVGQRTEKRK